MRVKLGNYRRSVYCKGIVSKACNRQSIGKRKFTVPMRDLHFERGKFAGSGTKQRHRWERRAGECGDN